MASGEDHEDDPDPVPTTSTDNEELPGRGSTRSRPLRVAAQVARYRLEELAARDLY